jgi:hypothetical protein
MSLLSQMWKTHKRNVQNGAQVEARDIDIEALAVDFVTGLSLRE